MNIGRGLWMILMAGNNPAVQRPAGSSAYPNITPMLSIHYHSSYVTIQGQPKQINTLVCLLGWHGVHGIKLKLKPQMPPTW
uniref:Uncharacterized protein n=1 Tax=Pyxicephalus adspersus TaxID=30357 RepID=A0AAV2ZMM6_PYXAD|nr:TPA: hypothetical protein GDO54_002305 [Pyxicephalus adspersus]